MKRLGVLFDEKLRHEVHSGMVDAFLGDRHPVHPTHVRTAGRWGRHRPTSDHHSTLWTAVEDGLELQTNGRDR